MVVMGAQVVRHRKEVFRWVRKELSGYFDTCELLDGMNSLLKKDSKSLTRMRGLEIMLVRY